MDATCSEEGRLTLPASGPGIWLCPSCISCDDAANVTEQGRPSGHPWAGQESLWPTLLHPGHGDRTFFSAQSRQSVLVANSPYVPSPGWCKCFECHVLCQGQAASLLKEVPLLKKLLLGYRKVPVPLLSNVHEGRIFPGNEASSRT